MARSPLVNLFTVISSLLIFSTGLVDMRTVVKSSPKQLAGTMQQVKISALSSLADEFVCPVANGVFPVSPGVCSSFYYLCANYVVFIENCPDNYLFDESAGRCVEETSCSPGTIPPTTVTKSTTTATTSTTPATTPTTTATTPTTPATTSTTSAATSTTSTTPATTPTTSTTTAATSTTSTTPATTPTTSTTAAATSTTSTTAATTPTTTAATSTTPATTPTTTEKGSTTAGPFVCPDDGFYAYDGYCSNFYWACYGGTADLMKCPHEWVFNPDNSNCEPLSYHPDCPQNKFF